jgi:hypothetical protein
VAKFGSALLALTLTLAAAFPAVAGSHGRAAVHRGFHGGYLFGYHRPVVIVGGFGGFYAPWFGYPVPFAEEEEAPSVLYPPLAPPAALWYFCPPADAYYPYVETCPVPWQPVPTMPATP